MIVFELEQDLPQKTVYLCYDDSRIMKLVFNGYKNDEGLDQTNVQGDLLLMGQNLSVSSRLMQYTVLSENH